MGSNRRGPWDSLRAITGSAAALEARVTSLEDTYVKTLWFESIGSGISGAVTIPTGGAIVLDQWSAGVDAVVSEIVSGVPTFGPVRDAAGTFITTSMDAAGNYVLSAAPVAYPVAVVYVYRVKFEDWDDTKSIGEAELIDEDPLMDQPFFNGSFIESFNALVTSDGVTVTMSVEQSGGGDLTQVFSSGRPIFDCTPADTLVLTAGSDASPTSNYVYILESNPGVLVSSTSDWPTTEHIKISYFFVPSAATVLADGGAFINQNWNDHRAGTNLQGHMTHMGETIRLTMGGASWHSGVTANGLTNGYITIIGADTPDSVYFASAAGVCYQMHKHNIPAINMQAGDDCHIPNAFGSAYKSVSDIGDELVDSLGVSLSGRIYNIVMWGVANKTGEYSPLMMNMPTGSYNNSTSAIQDSLGYDVYDIPREFKEESSTAFLICRITLQHSPATGGVFSVLNTVDLRGRTPGTASGGSVGGATDFADNQFSIFNVTDNTKEIDFDLAGMTTGIARTIFPADADMKILSSVNHDDLTDGAESTLHYHNALKDGGQIGALYTNAGAFVANFNGILSIETNASGISVGNGTDTADLDFSGIDFVITNRAHGGDLVLQGETLAAGVLKNIFIGGPDGNSTMYNAGLPMIETMADGATLVDGKITIRSVSGSLFIRSHVDGDTIRLEADNSSSINTPMLILDPDTKSMQLNSGIYVDSIVDDDTMASATATNLSSSESIKAYADSLIAANDAMVYKGAIDCSTNPNYPAADAGNTYKVSVAGKIGGASGEVVEAGDMMICLVDSSASGDQAAVGANWNVLQVNIDGAVIGPVSSTDHAVARFDLGTGKLIQNSVMIVSDTGLISGVTNTNWDAAYSHSNVTTGNPHSVSLSDVGAIANVVEDTTPQLGGDLDLNGKSLIFDPASLADLAYEGEVVSVTVDTNATGVGASLYMAADGNFDETDADAVVTMPCRALALETGTGTKLVLLRGYLRNDTWGWTIGGDIFVDITTGALTQTKPTGSADVVQIVGFAWTADIIRFTPGDYSTVEIA